MSCHGVVTVLSHLDRDAGNAGSSVHQMHTFLAAMLTMKSPSRNATLEVQWKIARFPVQRNIVMEVYPHSKLQWLLCRNEQPNPLLVVWLVLDEWQQAPLTLAHHVL